MTLQNALGDLALDETLQQFAQFMVDQQRSLPRELARTNDDILRVVINSGTSAINAILLWNNGGYVAPYGGTGSVNSVDMREQQRELSQQTAQQTRNRWVIT